MSSLFGIAANGASSFYNGATSASMRFRRGIGSNTEINRDPSSAGDRKKHTVSVWVKRTKPSDGSQVLLGGFASSYSDFLYFRSDDRLEYTLGNAYSVATDMKFRDISNWYHIVTHFDVANSTTTDRLKFYVNGVEQSKTVTYGSYPANQNYAFSNTVDQTIGGLTHFGGYELDGYLCDYHFIDGSLVSHNSFGEFKNGLWIPKIVNTGAITYGTNGFRLEFKGTDTDGPSTSGSVNSNSVGASSVNSNHFHAYSTALANHSALPDNPENNFCTLNPLNANDHRGEGIFYEGALRMTSSSGNRGFTTGTMKLHGKVYFEVLCKAGQNGFVGIADIENAVSGNSAGQSLDFYNGTPRIDGSAQSNTGTFSNGDIMGVKVDVDAKSIEFFRNNSSVYSATYSQDAEYFPFLHDSSGGRSSDFVANFGQDSSFSGEKTAQGNTDSNGQGDFYYTPPSGFLALCSANLPDTNLAPNQLEQATDYFNTHLYSGDGNSTQNVTGVGFQPDWTWIKERSSTSGHVIADTNRGYDKYLTPHTSNVESTGILNSVLSDGFQTTNSGASNENGQTYVSWNWKLNGGTTSTDNNGSLASTIQTNPEVGISIATFNVPTQANFSFGHGLGSVPEMFWWKSRTNTQNWIVYHFAKTTSVPNQTGMYLNSTLAGFTSGGNWITELSSTRIAITDGQVSSGSNRDNVVYSFKSIEGFSKIGSYTGNGNANGTFVYTGFKPAYLMVKRLTSNGYNWLIVDNKRDPINEVDTILSANTTNADNGSSTVDFDFLSNGFKCRNNNSNMNNSGISHLYMAFAEQPFKFSNAR